MLQCYSMTSFQDADWKDYMFVVWADGKVGRAGEGTAEGGGADIALL